MNSSRLIAIAALIAAFMAKCPADPGALFRDKVQPLLESRCISCHGMDKVKGGLRLDSREAVLQAGDSGQPAVVRHKPEQSLLFQVVMHAKKDLELPPKEKLASCDIAVLEEWIRDGAPWPQPVTLEVTAARTNASMRLGDAWSDPRNPIVRIFDGHRLHQSSGSVNGNDQLRPPRRLSAEQLRDALLAGANPSRCYFPRLAPWATLCRCSAALPTDA